MFLSEGEDRAGEAGSLVYRSLRRKEDDLWAAQCHNHPERALLLPGPGGFGRRSPGAHYHTHAFHQSSAYLAASLTYGPQVTDSHLAAYTDPVMAFTDDTATAAHNHPHPNVSAFTHRHGNPSRYRHTDYRTDRYAYCHRHSVSHRYTHSDGHGHSHAHSNGHGYPHALTHPHGLAHCHTYRDSHGYGYSHSYGNQSANRYPNSHALSHEPAH